MSLRWTKAFTHTVKKAFSILVRDQPNCKSGVQTNGRFKSCSCMGTLLCYLLQLFASIFQDAFNHQKSMAALLHQTSILQRPEDNPDPENKFSMVYPHVRLQTDQFSLCMTFSNRLAFSFYRVGHECKHLAYLQRAGVLFGEIRQKNIGKVDEEGTYCLLGSIIKPGGKKDKKICALEHQQQSSHPSKGPACICFPPRCIPDPQEVVRGEKRQFGQLQILKKPQTKPKTHFGTYQLSLADLLLSFSLQQRAVHPPVPSPASVSPTGSRCREGVRLLIIFAPIHRELDRVPKLF